MKLQNRIYDDSMNFFQLILANMLYIRREKRLTLPLLQIYDRSQIPPFRVLSWGVGDLEIVPGHTNKKSLRLNIFFA